MVLFLLQNVKELVSQAQRKLDNLPSQTPGNHSNLPQQQSSTATNPRQPATWKQLSKKPLPPWKQHTSDTGSTVDTEPVAKKPVPWKHSTGNLESTTAAEEKSDKNLANENLDTSDVIETSTSDALLEKKKALQEAKVAKLENYIGQSPIPDIQSLNSPVPQTVRRGFKPPG